ncbi:MAG: D-alanine--D-alanine ligase [Actinomycetota bacterium]|nr:D-alanine--D-alanine ligase [Actinomycetota bacterium]
MIAGRIELARLSIGVIFGGRSVEHDVSVVTAHQVMAVLGDDHDIVPIYISREGRWYTGAGLNDLDVYKNQTWSTAGEEAFIPPSADYGGLLAPASSRFGKGRRIPLDVVVPSIHGTFGEDGTLQGLLELADIPYAGSGVTGSAAGMDKITMKAVFTAAGLPVVPHVVVETSKLVADENAVLDEIERDIGYPAFVKPSRLGSSVGIGKARERSGLAEALDVARRYDSRLLVETAMEGCSEINCAVLGGPGFEPSASVCEQPVAWEEFLTFSDKYLRAGKSGAKEPEGTGGAGMAGLQRRIPAPLSDELTKQVQDNAVRAFRAIDAAGVARIDAFVNESSGETWVMEINTVPGSFAFYLWEASGMSFRELMNRLVEIAIAGYKNKSELMFTFESTMLSSLGGDKTSG